MAGSLPDEDRCEPPPSSCRWVTRAVLKTQSDAGRITNAVRYRIRVRMMLKVLLLCSPAIYLGFTILGEIFVHVTISNPTIEVVTFRLRG